MCIRVQVQLLSMGWLWGFVQLSHNRVGLLQLNKAHFPSGGQAQSWGVAQCSLSGGLVDQDVEDESLRTQVRTKVRACGMEGECQYVAQAGVCVHEFFDS